MKPQLGVGAWLTLPALLAVLVYVGSFAVLVVDATLGAYLISETLQKRFPERYDGIVDAADFLYFHADADRRSGCPSPKPAWPIRLATRPS